MRPIETFSIEDGPGTNSPDAFHIKLRFGGKPSDLLLWGDTIEHQYEIGSAYLLITHYDYWEGTNYWFNLLDRQLRLIDVISPPEQQGFMERLSNPAANILEFSFFNTEARWRLCVLDEPHWDFRPGAVFQRPLRFWPARRLLTLDRFPSPIIAAQEPAAPGME
jgi:hypothetical protein